MRKGQVQLATVAIIGVVSFVGSWIGGYILNSPKQAEEAIASVKNDVSEVKTRLSLLCNDYGQTVSRVDQNLQIIGEALKVKVVTGKTNVDPCKTQ